MAVSKSDHIRQLLSEQPTLSPSQIQAVLADRGVAVSRNLCKVVRHREQQASAKDKPTTERQLRRGETRIRTRVVRLSDEDIAIWDFVQVYATKLENPGFELRVMDGRIIRLHRKVRHWLESVSTRNAKRRREEILDQFIADLARQHPMPVTNERLPRPPKRRRRTTGTRRELTAEEREARMKDRLEE